MSQERGSDPFQEPYQQAVHPPPPAQQPTFAATAAYGGAGLQTAPPPGYTPAYNFTNAYNTYGASLNNMYNTSYSPYNTYAPAYAPYASQRQTATTQLASGARETGEMVLSGMHEAMARFARVSSMIEEVLRHLHMLFDAIFGLGYSVGAFRREAAQWLAVKTGPVAYLARLIRRAANLWRLLCLFFMSPAAGRFSPVALVLRILGLVPEDDPLEHSLAERWAAGGEPDASTRGFFDGHPLADASNM